MSAVAALAILCTSVEGLLLRGASVSTQQHYGRTRVTMGVGNSFGRLFRISTWGESHGGGVGVTLDGCPPRLPITEEEGRRHTLDSILHLCHLVGPLLNHLINSPTQIQKELSRRRPGQSRLTTPRNGEWS